MNLLYTVLSYLIMQYFIWQSLAVTQICVIQCKSMARIFQQQTFPTSQSIESRISCIINSFKKCGVSNALDGTRDMMLYAELADWAPIAIFSSCVDKCSVLFWFWECLCVCFMCVFPYYVSIHSYVTLTPVTLCYVLHVAGYFSGMSHVAHQPLVTLLTVLIICLFTRVFVMLLSESTCLFPFIYPDSCNISVPDASFLYGPV